MDQLRKDFDAVFVASGANGSAKIRLEGSKKNGVLWGWDFLRDVGLGKSFDFDGDIIVVGGGNVAIDAALTARRLGGANVSLFCLESRAEMPAHEWEIDRAEEEDVSINNSWGPKKILGEEAVTGLGLVKCTSVFDNEGTFNPTYDEEITNRVTANHIILAVGQSADLDFLKDEKNINTSGGRIEVVETSLATGEEGVFAGGDVVSGPDSIIGAIAHGRTSAAAIDEYLGGNGNIDEKLATPEEEVLLPEFVPNVKPRNDLGLLRPWERTTGFNQVELGLTDEQIEIESSRCLNCDARKFEVILNTEHCKECGYCAEVCDVGIFGPADFFNAKGYRPEEVKSSDRCVGCFKCYFACPDFAIDVVELTA
jgi:NADPH-dependent glutamate synthase beta subunit-like oxidoreductase